jgi:hypothetical protein
MARKILTDECGRRTLGIVRVASTVPPAGAARRGYEVARVEAPDWVVTWSRVTVTR